MQIKFDVFWPKNLGTLYKENSIDTIGKDGFVDLDLNKVYNIMVNFEVGDKSYTDLVEVVDIEKGQIRIPFKADVIKKGTNKLELIATMKNGDVKPSQTYIYEIGESLENPNNIEAETNYPILISLLQEVRDKLEAIDDAVDEIEEVRDKLEAIDDAVSKVNDAVDKIEEVRDKLEAIDDAVDEIEEVRDKLEAIDDAVSKVNDAVDKIDAAIGQCKDEIYKGLDDMFVEYKENTDRSLENKFEAYVNSTSENIDNLVEAKTSQVNSKIEEVNELIDSVEASESNREERHNAKIEELNSYSNEVNTLKQNISTNAKDIEDLKADVESNTHRINQISDTVNSHEDRIKTNEKYTRNHELLLNSLFEEDASESITLSNQEGTVISLPQSVNGAIEIKELQGNTMVNNCTDGAKELILNNEIDAEGANIALTDTVDNGLVDVVCEGNTLILDAEGNEVEAGTEGARLVSVGELEDNKIEMLSSNDTLLIDNEELKIKGELYNTKGWSAIKINKNVDRVKIVVTNKDGLARDCKLSIKNHIESEENMMLLFDMKTPFDTIEKDYTLKGSNVLSFCTYGSNIMRTDFLDYYDIKVYSYDSMCDLVSSVKRNKKEIQLSEPLRGLPNGVCDKFVKQGGKWYVERNCGEVVLNGSQDCSISDSNEMYSSILRLWIRNISNLEKYGKILCDKLPIAEREDYPSIVCTNGLDVHLPLNNDTSLEVAKQWLSENPITLVYQVATPTYEEITDPQVTTYLDTTHISTNSTIPCNMQVKNSGYNAIIKPSKKYTVAFDTDKSGEVNIGLGGAKASTTNNVATITTPSTLIDDSLTLYGKGIEASNVRLLEGDKTNYIPSYFEGMKSCFEDKEQDNGSYKVEIISSNLNNSKSDKLQLQLNEPLRAVGDVKDKFVFKDDKLTIKRSLGERYYQEGDEYLDNALTDMTRTVYVLDEPYYEEVPFELQKITLECYKDGTLFFDTNIPPTSTVTYSASIPVVSRLNDLDTMSTNLVSTTWDMDYRLFELEWTLYECMAMTVDIDKIFNIRRNDTMALSRFEQAKIMILGGAYNDTTLRKQLGTYKNREIITQEEYDELISMMDARLLVEGN